jgi:hypothetical protein
MDKGSPAGPAVSLRRTATLLTSNRCCRFGSDQCGLDPREYSIRFVTNDGSELKFSLRGLFERFFHEVTGR